MTPQDKPMAFVPKAGTWQDIPQRRIRYALDVLEGIETCAAKSIAAGGEPRQMLVILQMRGGFTVSVQPFAGSSLDDAGEDKCHPAPPASNPASPSTAPTRTRAPG